jgi:cytochrome P450
MAFYSLVTISGFAFVVISWIANSMLTQRRSKLPPGPPRLPIIGNLHQFPKINPWRTFQEWTKQYGPIYSLQFGLNTVIVLGNHEVAHDILDKRSNIYSSRPRSVMGGEVVSKGYRTVLMPYGQRWRDHQRLQGAFLNIRTAQSYRPLQELESLQVVHELLEPDVDFADRYHRYSSSLIFALAYGRRMPRGDEREVLAIDELMRNFVYAARVGTWIVDALPLLNYLPKFLAPWKRIGDHYHDFESKLFMDSFDEAQQTKSWNWSKQAREMKGHSMPHKELAYDVGVLYEAGSDTTTTALNIFTMAMLLYPEAMRKGQAELDAVVGGSRLPTIEDKENLPYINAIIRETLRWRPVAAGGVPHAVTQDDEYMGYLIPKGTTVIPNHWAIHLDDNVYKDPYEYNPDRWIEDPNLPFAAFGHGRRVCTGQHIAKNSLFLNIAKILWTFDLGYKYKLVNGKKERCEVDPFAFTQGFVSGPEPFEASFVAREGREKIVRKAWESAEKDLDVIIKRPPPESADKGMQV